MSDIFELYDEVKNVKNEYTGTVVAIYNDSDGEPVIDIKLEDDSIWYHSDVNNWKKVRSESYE